MISITLNLSFECDPKGIEHLLKKYFWKNICIKTGYKDLYNEVFRSIDTEGYYLIINKETKKEYSLHRDLINNIAISNGSITIFMK